MKLATVCPSSSPSFLATAEKALAKGFEVRRFSDEDTAGAYAWGDAVWAEWALCHAYDLSCGVKPLVIRLHRFELWEPWLSMIQWSRVRLLIVGSTEIRDMACARMSAIESVPTLIMPAPMDLDAWPERTVQPDGHRIGVVANFDARKNPPAWLEVLSHLPEEFTLHIVGGWKDAWIRTWWEHAAKPFGDRITLYGPLPHEKLAAFWSDKRWCLAAGLHETAGPMAALEAAACGVWPIVYEYPAAWEFWTGEADAFLWRDVAHAVKLIRFTEPMGQPSRVRQIARDHSVQTRGPQLLAAVTEACR